jgi:hypothetical protein
MLHLISKSSLASKWQQTPSSLSNPSMTSLSKCPSSKVQGVASEEENETNKVCSHKNYPKYLEYNKVIHVGIMYKIRIDKMIYNFE